METPKEEEYDWSSLLSTFEDYGTTVLKMIAPRELSGDPNFGVTEMGFKLVLLGFFATRLVDFEVESEREVEGGRIDIFVRHRETGSLLVIELKYLRLGFLEKARKGISQSTPNAIVNKQYKQVNEEILGLEWNALKEVSKLDFYNGIKTTTNIETIVLEATSQASRYTDLLTRGGIRRLPDSKRVIHYVAVIGVGSRVYCAEVHKMHSLVIVEKK